MPMRASFELEFSSGAEARKALSVLESELKSEKGELEAKVAGRKIVAEVSASSFTGLRAISTSFLRNAKIVYDVIDAVGKE
jgi:tRNA threonylcarbamoyladenosine modification (KEOPS) complex  Pcc1 subunit